jgi:glycosyltransferase involved in cell wall biosynthesis
VPRDSDISVVIPMYNRADLMTETLEAVLSQTMPAADVIVVDDGSTDEEVAKLRRFANAIQIVRQHNQGVQRARNVGIRHATTPWVALCDTDDVWQPDWLERITALRSADPKIDFIFGNFRILRDGVLAEDTKFDDAPAKYWEGANVERMPEGWAFRSPLAGSTFRWHPMFPSAMAFSKDLLARTGAFDPKLNGRSNEDGEFTLRLLYQASAGAIPEARVTIRKHDENFSRDRLQNLIDEIWSLDFVKRNHSEARPYIGIIDEEIVRRSIAAANLAFVVHDHDLARRLIKSVAWKQRPLKLHLKHLVAALPEPVAIPANDLLQRIAERG